MPEGAFWNTAWLIQAPAPRRRDLGFGSAASKVQEQQDRQRKEAGGTSPQPWKGKVQVPSSTQGRVKPAWDPGGGPVLQPRPLRTLVDSHGKS